jgi:uncharacterized protein YfaS (alpha-2-macroglobulin family)
MKRFLTVLTLVCVTTAAHAHSPWMTVDKEGNVAYFFGEDLTDQTYKLPAGIAKAEISMRAGGKTMPVETEQVESDDFIGKRSVTSVPTGADLMSQATFGVYHGAKLQYYTQHLGSKMPTEFAKCQPIENTDLQAHAVDTESGVDVYLLWKGEALAGAEIKLTCKDGHEEGSGKTDASGKVSFTDSEVEDGMNGISVVHTVGDETGTVGEEPYKSAMHYLTATFVDPEDK